MSHSSRGQDVLDALFDNLFLALSFGSLTYIGLTLVGVPLSILAYFGIVLLAWTTHTLLANAVRVGNVASYEHLDEILGDDDDEEGYDAE